jgi:hypothetical protein
MQREEEIHDPIKRSCLEVRACVNGPYGRSPSLVSYDTSVLIAG